MSTTISQTELTRTLPKSIAKLNKMVEKPRFNRSSSIDTIKKINSYICSPQTYILPAILTTWLKSGQNGLQASTEKTIFMFRFLFFRSFLFKFVLNGTRVGSLAAAKTGKLDFQSVSRLIYDDLQEQLFIVLNSMFVISLAFKLAIVLLVAQMGLCVFYIAQSIVPLGLSFLILSSVYIVILSHRVNRFYLGKRDIKRKSN